MAAACSTRPIFEALEYPDDRPDEISRFVRLWLAALAASAAIALLLAIARRRSNVARWLLAVPFNLLVVFYDLSHLDEEMARGALVYVVLLRLGLMAVATWNLFTVPARAWFRNPPAAAE